jgi:hypothetical protein
MLPRFAILEIAMGPSLDKDPLNNSELSSMRPRLTYTAFGKFEEFEERWQMYIYSSLQEL